MKDLWSSRWLCLLLPAIVSTLGPMVLAGTVKDVLADHAIGTEAQLAWQARLLKVEQAMAANEFTRAELLWRDAYAAALKSRHWEGMVAVADTYRALGARAVQSLPLGGSDEQDPPYFFTHFCRQPPDALASQLPVSPAKTLPSLSAPIPSGRVPWT